MNKFGWVLACICVVSLGMGCQPYDDGPKLSFRSRDSRLNFTRPITYYTVDGVDSLAGLVRYFQDSLVDYTGQFNFFYEAWVTECPIYNSDEQFDKEFLGVFSTGDSRKETSINIGLNRQPFPVIDWEITRLSHKEFWIKNVVGGVVRELRFEE